MAETLEPSKIVIPNADGEEAISTVGVTELRTAGATANTAIAALIEEIATAWAKGSIGGEGVNGLIESGSYVRTGSIYESAGYPLDADNTYTHIVLRRIGTAPMRAIMHANVTLSNGRVRNFQRTETDGVWGDWTETGPINVVLGGVDLDTLVSSGDYVRAGSIYQSLGYPIDAGGNTFTKIRLDRIGTAPMRATMSALIITEHSVQQYARAQGSDETWGPWGLVGGGGGSGGTATTEMESTGRWTSQPAEESYLRSLATHEYVHMFEIGRSVENRPIWALQVGPGEAEYPNQKRSVLFTAGMHGDEPGPREGALQFIRDLVNPKVITYDKIHMVAVVVPTLNPDRIMDTRNNANNVNLNRDFLDYTQPESQALRSLMQSPDHDFVAFIDAHNGGYGNAVSTRWNDQDPEATALVKQLSEDMDRQIADRYIQQGMPWRMYGEPGFEGIPGDGTLINGAFMRFGGQFGVPSELIEVPRTFRSFPAWQAQITKEAFHEVWEYVSVHREEFKAAKTAAGF